LFAELELLAYFEFIKSSIIVFVIVIAIDIIITITTIDRLSMNSIIMCVTNEWAVIVCLFMMEVH
jgi:hypothetical protein